MSSVFIITEIVPSVSGMIIGVYQDQAAAESRLRILEDTQTAEYAIYELDEYYVQD